ncbi:hypothetical protein J2T28_002573 [Kerstersia gyiorum]|uniref:hypothetical protein n=1 Tax=Kerstersia gyiorum TaxID=206506 RepID=UPI0039F6507A|nr:hypothetical protein [Kerstersia gyiorum]
MSTLNLSYAQAAALALTEAMEADPSVVALGEDLGRGGVFGQYRDLENQPLVQRFGEQRIVDTPISEAAIVGASVGMALAGLKPVVELRVVDFALCAIDEIVNQAAKNRFMFGGQGRWHGGALAHRLVERLGGAAFAIPGSLVCAYSRADRRDAGDAGRQLWPAACCARIR